MGIIEQNIVITPQHGFGLEAELVCNSKDSITLLDDILHDLLSGTRRDRGKRQSHAGNAIEHGRAFVFCPLFLGTLDLFPVRPDLIDGIIDGECRAKLLALLLPRPQ